LRAQLLVKLTTLVNGVERQLDLKTPGDSGGAYAFSLDGQQGSADIREVVPGVYSVLLGARSFEVKIEYGEAGYSVTVGGRRYEVIVRDPRRLSRGDAAVAAAGPRQLTAPMPGKVVRVMVEEGQSVESGQGLVVVEAMKMQNEIKSPKAGVVKTVHVREGGSVSAGQVLLVVE
jgi:biotin carboxyl carrier protein